MYTLYRVEDDASTTYIDEYPSVVEGITAGQHVVKTEDFDFSYALYTDGAKVASFAEGRIGYREWARRNGRLADIHSVDDRLDHHVDELLAQHLIYLIERTGQMLSPLPRPPSCCDRHSRMLRW